MHRVAVVAAELYIMKALFQKKFSSTFFSNFVYTHKLLSKNLMREIAF